LFSNNSAGPVNFNNKQSNYSSPLFTTDLFGNSPIPSNHSAPASIFGQNQQQTTASLLDSFAMTLTSLTQGQTPRTLSNGFNSIAPSSTSSATFSTFSPTPNGSLVDMNDPLFNTWRDNSISTNGDDNGFDIFETMFSSMSPGAFNLVDTSGLTDFINDSPITMSHPQEQQEQLLQLQNVTATGEPRLTCPEFWEQVTNHPKFDDIDMDELCAEMRSKAKVCALSKSVKFSITLAQNGELRQTWNF
jgi:hypothetical protein